MILSIYFSVNLLSFFASNFILFQNDTKLYCQRQFVRRRNRPTDQTRFQHGFNSWDFHSESSWRRHCEQNWFQKWQILSPLFSSTHFSMALMHDQWSWPLYRNCHNWIKFCSLCTKKGLSCTEGTGILDKIVVYGCMFKPDNITIHDINTGEIIDYTEDFEFDEDTLRLDVNQLFGVDFCSRAFRITWSKNIFYT